MEHTPTLDSNRKIIVKIAQLILFLGLGVLLVWLSIRSLSKEDMQHIFDSIRTINNSFSWIMLGMAALMVLLSDVIRAFRVRLQMEALNYQVRFSMVFYSVMVCYLANLGLPRLGEIVRCSFLQRFEAVPFQKSLGVVVTERAVDMVCWLTLLLLAFLCNTNLFSDLIINRETGLSLGMWMEQKGLSLFSNYLIYILLAIVLVGCVTIYLTRRWWNKIEFCRKIKRFVLGIWQGFIAIKDIKHPCRYVIWTILLWVVYFLGNYFCFLAIPYLSGVGPGAAYMVLVFSTIAFIISQGGLGSYPLIVAGILYLYQISYTQGIAAGWIGWLMQTAVVLVLGSLSLLLAGFYSKKSSEMAN